MRDQVRRVLIAEDLPDAARPLARPFKKKPAWEIAVVNDGDIALDFLLRRGGYTDVWRPDLFILNINMPRVDGLEVLEQAMLVSRGSRVDYPSKWRRERE